MAEVKSLPSAVGAFEAQIFDMSRTYQAITSMMAAQRRQQAEAKKEADKTLTELANLKAAGRSQDLEYLSGIKKELTDYFSQNRDKIQPGTDEYNKYNEIKTNFIYETEKSKNEKVKEARFATYASANAAKMKLSDNAKEIIEIQKLSINDPRRKEWKKKYDDGRDAGIDDLDLPDLEKFSIFDETQIQRDIKSSPGATYDVKDVEFNKQFKNLKSPYPITITGTTRITDPFTVARTYISYVDKTPDTLDKYTKEFNMLTDDQKQAVTEEMKAMNDVFKAAGASNFQFEDDDTAGVTNPFEYGLYVNLKRNLPRDLGQTVSASVGNLFKVRAYGRRGEDKKSEPIDAEMSKQIDNGTVNWEGWMTDMNTIAGRNTLGVGISPFNVDLRDGQATAVIRTFLKDDDDELIDDLSKARTKMKNKKFKLERDAASGNYYYTETKRYDLRKSNPSYKMDVQNLWNDAKAAQYDPDSRELIERNLKIQPSAGAVSPGKASRR